MEDPKEGNAQQSIETLGRLARVWHRKGQTALAAKYYRQILAVVPGKAEVFDELVALFTQQDDWAAVAEVCRQWLAQFPDNATHSHSNHVHKLYIDALVQQGGIDMAFHEYQLARQDSKSINIEPDDLLCCAVMRNEEARLPYFLDYYRRQGITKFLIVDNASTDNSLAYLLNQPDVYTWHSAHSYKKTNCGAAWWELLLRRYCVDRWVLVVDADELLYYPNCEEKVLPELCKELEADGKSAFKALMLDMYGNKSIQATNYTPGTDFLAACPYFDRQFYHIKLPSDGPFRNMTNYWGGARTRVFGGSYSGYLLNKVPLFIYQKDDVLFSGQHWIKRAPDQISNQSGALLHFKYFASFPEYVKQEAIRREHARLAAVYQEYASHLAEDAALTFYDPLHSIRFENSAQLLRLGVMQDGTEEKRALNPKDIYFPPILPLSSATSRPFWSVMIVMDARMIELDSQVVERCLRSVVAQLPRGEDVQLEIVFDHKSKHFRQDVEAIVSRIDDSRLQVFQSNRYLGHPTLFTLCLERAEGQWVHIITANDWLSPGFYAALRNGIESWPDVGAAFCRFDYTQAAECLARKRMSDDQHMAAPLESPTPGILATWLPRIAVQNRVSYSAMVVKRATYEQVGGFCLSAATAAQWEMCKRISHQYPVYYEPQTLAHVSRNQRNIEHRYSQYGLPLRHALAAIDIAGSYLPAHLREPLSQEARKAVATQAIAIAKTYLQQGDYRAALANLGEGLSQDSIQTQSINTELLSLFSQVVT